MRYAMLMTAALVAACAGNDSSPARTPGPSVIGPADHDALEREAEAAPTPDWAIIPPGPDEVKPASVAADWPPHPPRPPRNPLVELELGTLPDYSLECRLSSADRIAYVEVEGVVREASVKCANHVTVYRVRVLNTLAGAPLPSIVYAGAHTGYEACEEIGLEKPTRMPIARVRLGDRGVAFIKLSGRDGIASGRAHAHGQQLSRSVRGVSMNHFTPERDGKLVWDAYADEPLGRDYWRPKAEDAPRVDGIDSLRRTLSTLGPPSAETCLGNLMHRYPCRNRCGTASSCEVREGAAVCLCADGGTDCEKLPPEDPERCNMYPQAPMNERGTFSEVPVE